jgi:tetratricopeptide (TPR) repeat protein
MKSARRFAVAFLLAAAFLPHTALAQEPPDKQKRQEAFRHYQAGITHMRSEDWDQAAREFKAAIRLDPLMTLAHYSLGQTYMATKSYPDAVKAFEACNEAYMKLASLEITDSALSDQRRHEEIRELREAIQGFQSGTLKTSQVQMQVLKLENRLAELERTKSRGTQTAEIPAEFSLALGSAHFRSGALPQAEEHYKAALKANPKMGEAHNNVAVVYMLTGRLDEAKAEVKLAEKAGFKVNPKFKEDLEQRLKGR